MSEIENIFRRESQKPWQNDVLVLWSLSKPHIGRIIAALICSAVLAGINGLIAWSVKPAIDSIFVSKSSGSLYLLTAGVLILFFFRGIFTFFNNYLLNSVGAKVVKSLRTSIYDKLLTVPMSYFGKTSSGSVVSKLINDVGLLQNIITHTTRDFLVESGSAIVLAGVAIYRKWDLALFALIVVPLIVYSIANFGKRMKKTSKKTQIFLGKITSIVHESLHGIKIIKAFTLEKVMSRSHEAALTEHYRSFMRETRINEFSSLLSEVFGGIGVAAVLFYGGSLVISGAISSGDFFSVAGAFLMMYTPLRRLSRVNNNFQQGRSVIERVRHIFYTKDEKTGSIEKDITGHVVFKNVSFRYPAAEVNALTDINLEVMPGEIVALVGHSGAGKSTLADMVGGFWRPAEGNIYIDGVDINDLSTNSLRKHMGIVTQDVILFDDSIKTNIIFGRANANDDEIIEASKNAFAHEFITELPEGYDTKIGERGVRLSGGQKQRITIARAILRNPSILILDEATSSLDTESEQKVQLALERLMENRTTIVIAHRLSTIRKASKIIVMEQGKIVQCGTHEELLASGGLYQELYNLQFLSQRQ